MQRSERAKNKIGILASPFVLAVLSLVAAPAQGMAEQGIVATTSLTAAIAKAAGAKEVTVLTPPGQKHPPEYDLRPSDLLKIEGAAVVIYAGYEKMVSKLLETTKNKGIHAVQISTETSPENLVSQARKISRLLGSEKEEATWEQRFLEALGGMEQNLAPYAGRRAVVHPFGQPFAKWARLSIVQVIRPGELTPRVIAQAVEKAPDVVVDVLHFPIARVIAENAGCKYVQVINFPGVKETSSLEDVFRYNSTEFIRAFQP